MRRNPMIAAVVVAILCLVLGATVEAVMSSARGWLAADSGAGKSDTYRAGQRALDDKRWEEAADLFGQIGDVGGGEADAALYWEAYALNRAGRKGEAVSTLARLQSRYPDSSWIDDAKALELEAAGADSPRVRSRSAEDEELRLYALNSLMHVESEKAIPVLAEFLREESSPELKEKALFILSQSDSPQAREILASVARDQEHPELALKAVELLGFYDDSEGRRLLEEIYQSTGDERVKSKVIEALMIAEDGDRLLEIARGEESPELRRKAVEMLGVMEGTRQLGELYKTETDVEVKAKILEAFFIADDADTLLEAAMSETEPRLRQKAIEGLGLIGNSRAQAGLKSLYQSSTDPRDREKIIEAFFLSDDADTLLEMVRTEQDPKLRRKAIESLGLIGDSRAGEALTGLYESSSDGEEKKQILQAFFLQDNYRQLIEIVRTEEDLELKKKAVELLSLIDSDEATEFVLGLLED